MEFRPKGLVPALVTPITADGRLNEQATRKLIDYVIEAGVHGVFVSGTAGEFYGLHPEDKKELFQVTVDQTRGRVPVYAGTGAITTRDAVALTNMAQDCGVDTVSVLTPMFMSPSQAELIGHYTTIAGNSDLPILLYNNVPKTNVPITGATVEELADLDNIVGIKDSSGDFTLTIDYIRRTRDKDFDVMIGRDTQIHACLCYGGAGAVAACANVAPKLCAEIYDKYMAGDVKGSLESQFALVPLRMAFSLGTHPATLKEALGLLGIDAGPCFGPPSAMGPDQKETLKGILKDLELI